MIGSTPLALAYEMIVVRGFPPVLPSNWNGAKYDAESIQSDVRTAVFQMVADSDPAMASDLQKAYSELSFTSGAKIPRLNTGLKLTHGCKRTQEAIQDFDTGKVTVTDSGDDELDNVSYPLLQIHEAYVRIGHFMGMDLPHSETFARDHLGPLVNSATFGQKLFPILFADSKIGLDWAFITEAIRDMILPPFPAEKTQQQKEFLGAVQALGLPCNFNQDAFNKISAYPQLSKLSYAPANDTGADSFETEYSNFVSVCSGSSSQ
jgi:hypothetical protein